MSAPSHRLAARRLGIDTGSEIVIFLRKDSAVCRAEGFSSYSRIALSGGEQHAIATLYQIESDLIGCEEAGLSNAAWRKLGLSEGDNVTASHALPVESLGFMRGRIFGQELSDASCLGMVRDIVDGRYSSIEISAFITACAAQPMSSGEIIAMTHAMVETGKRLAWGHAIIADKHSVGGLPGNRSTPIIVAICAALGLVIPKTSSRAITSPAGTADTMEVLAPVNLDERAIRTVIERENGCIAWGGAINLSPADDILIRVEKALDLDSAGQMIASVLSKKVAAGVTHLVIDMPVGPTAKVRGPEAAVALKAGLVSCADHFGIQLRVLEGDGRQPIGRGIGPALEARDVLAVLKGDPDAPDDLRERALELAGAILELTGKAADGNGAALARAVLDDGRAWVKFQRICEAQGGMRALPQSRHRKTLIADQDGVLATIDNRRIARLAKLAGAPDNKAAGVDMHVRLGAQMEAGKTPLCTVHAEAFGELAYALEYAEANGDMFGIAP